MRRGDLMRERAKLTNTAMLFDYAGKHGMVNPVGVKPIKVGVLPPEKVYWALPGEGEPEALSSASALGELPPAPQQGAGTM
jgi:hypothetical protein